MLVSLCLSAHGAVHYVNINSAAPAPPYSDWSTAAANIQDAVDAASEGDNIVVTNGVYQTGGRVVYGSMTNRVAVTKSLLVSSVNGPAVTVIKGYQVPGTTNGDSAVRCVYLTNGAVLAGFTLTNGATRTAGDPYQELNGGGAWCESVSGAVSNCVLTGNSAALYAGGAYYGTLNNCTLTGNSAGEGGGAYGGLLLNCTLNNCTLTGNSAEDGGGAYEATLNNCTLTGNLATNSGGGAIYSTLNNCTLTGNWASGPSGVSGGACRSTLNNCILTGNLAANFGGGATYSTLNNCIVYYNSAPSSPNYTSDSILNYCCTTPLPPGGAGNITAEPQLASASHLSALSPCRNAGSATYANGTDIDGEPWANPPAIGCDQFSAGAVTGPLSVSIQADYTNVATGFDAFFTGAIAARVTASQWDFGDGTIVSNRPFVSHAWGAPGDYPVVLRAFNDSNPGGVSATVIVRVVAQPVHYVALNSPTPRAPYSSWATAATRIQDAVDAATVAGAWVLVSNGVYQAGGQVVYGSMSNRLAVTKPLLVSSVNGPAVTVIKGYQVPGTTNGDSAVRCVYLADGAVLSGFTLTNGATRTTWYPDDENCGGGVWCQSVAAAVSNCVIAGNSAKAYAGGAFGGTLNNCTLTGNSADQGGGAYLGTLNNCTLTGNWTSGYFGCGGGVNQGTLNNCTITGNWASGTYGHGGGAYQGTFNNCTLTGNWTAGQNGSGGGSFGGTLNNCTLTGNWTSGSYGRGGGSSGGTLNNCIIYYNFLYYSSGQSGGNYDGPTLNYCCTTPSPGAGVANFTNAPLFIDLARGNLRLQNNSACINAGLSSYVSGLTDLDGNPRIVAGLVDVGAYEHQPHLLNVNELEPLVITNNANADPLVYHFTYGSRDELLADGWSFVATKPNGGGSRDTEVTNAATGALVDYDQTSRPQVLRIPCDVGDLEASANNSRNSLFHNLPPNWISVRLRLSLAPSANFQQAHLGLYQDDDNYLEVGVGYNSYRGGITMSMAFEANGNPTVTLTSNLVSATLFYFRLDRDLVSGAVTGLGSLDGASWTTMGSVSQSYANPRLVIWAGGAPVPWTDGLPIVELSELDIVVSNNTPRVLTYALVDPPSGAAIDTNGVITWTPSDAQGPGIYVITSVVSDNETPSWSATNSVTVQVNAVAPPRLTAGTTGDGLVISWPASLTNFLLESALNLSPGTLWTPVTNVLGSAAAEISVTIPRAGSQQFFRLRQQGP